MQISGMQISGKMAIYGLKPIIIQHFKPIKEA